MKRPFVLKEIPGIKVLADARAEIQDKEPTDQSYDHDWYTPW